MCVQHTWASVRQAPVVLLGHAIRRVLCRILSASSRPATSAGGECSMPPASQWPKGRPWLVASDGEGHPATQWGQLSTHGELRWKVRCACGASAMPTASAGKQTGSAWTAGYMRVGGRVYEC